MKLNKKFIFVSFLLIFLLLLSNIAYTDTKQFWMIACFVLAISLLASVLLNILLELLKKIISL